MSKKTEGIVAKIMEQNNVKNIDEQHQQILEDDKAAEEIIEGIFAKSYEQNESDQQGLPVSEDDKAAIDNFKYGFSEGSYGEICEKFDVQQNDDGPVFGPTD